MARKTLEVRLFAVLRERMGRETVEISLDGDTTVAALVAQLSLLYPAHAGIIGRCRVAVNQEFSDGVVKAGDEVALIPPVSGGASDGGDDGDEDPGGDLVALTRQPLDVTDVLRRIDSPGAGAQCVFLGVVRNTNEGRDVQKIQYEAYESMALAKMREISRELRAAFPVEKLVLVHRLGLLAVGEASVIVAVSTGHRDEGFKACRMGIDRLKEIVPIWKKEIFPDGSAWVGQQ